MTKLEKVARELAAAHRNSDPDTTTIKFFPARSEIRLLEVSKAAPTIGEVLPFRFGAAPAYKVDYPSIVILLSPGDWDALQVGGLRLPEGWTLASAKDL